MNFTPLRLLIVEDEAAHVEAIRRAFDLAATKPDLRVAGTLREYREMIAASPPDLALVDLNLPDGRATEVLTHPPENAPFPILVMTAFGSQQIVVEVMKAGALNYVVKSPEAFAAMPQAVARGLHEWQLHQQQTLSGLIHICAWCKKIRADEGDWKDFETFIAAHSRVHFSHGICPACETDNYRGDSGGHWGLNE